MTHWLIWLEIFNLNNYVTGINVHENSFIRSGYHAHDHMTKETKRKGGRMDTHTTMNTDGASENCCRIHHFVKSWCNLCNIISAELDERRVDWIPLAQDRIHWVRHCTFVLQNRPSVRFSTVILLKADSSVLISLRLDTGFEKQQKSIFKECRSFLLQLKDIQESGR
jgi:hypothetical protein